MGYSINYLAVLAGGIAYMALGALWYAPIFFGHPWMRALGKTEDQLKAEFNPINYLWAFIGSMIASYGIARLFAMTGGGNIMKAVLIALVGGVCLVGVAFFVNNTFAHRPRSLTFINIFYHIVGFLIMGVIIGAWQ